MAHPYPRRVPGVVDTGGMSRFLLAWEMGAGLGHVDRLLVWARELRRRGHEVLFALRDLAPAHARLGAEGFTALAAPCWLHPPRDAPRLGNHAAVLAAAGWLEPEGLAGLICAWRALLQLSRCDVLLTDHAPTAVLAARGQGLPVWAVGTSFECPPPAPFFPPMHYWDPREYERCPMYDHPLLVRANQALQSLGDSPLPRLSALYDGVGRALASFPELLHYDGHGAESPVVGPVFVVDRGATPRWPDEGDGPRVFVHVHHDHPALPALLAALAQRGWPAIAYLHGGRLAPGQPGSTGSLRLETRPLHLGQVLRDADLVVSHAGIGTVSAALLAGKCQLLLPAQTEQRMLARRAAAGGLALALEHGSAGPADLGQALDRLRDDPALASTVGELARRYHGLTPERVAERLVDLLQAGVPPTAHGAGTAAGRPGPGRSGTH